MGIEDRMSFDVITKHKLIAQSFYDHGYSLNQPYKNGAWGAIYLVEKFEDALEDPDADLPNTKVKMVAKIAKIAKLTNDPVGNLYLKYEWEKELYYCQYLYNNYKIGPRFFTAWTTEKLRKDEPITEGNQDLGVIILEKWDESLPSMTSFSTINPSLQEKLKQQIKIIHSNNLIHADVVPRNIFIKRDNNNKMIDITIGDMGSMRHIERFQDRMRRELKMIYQNHYQYKPEFFLKYKLDFEAILDDPRLLDYFYILF